MAKRAPRNRQTGSEGQTAVKLMFEKLGWGPVPVDEHDVGTDLFVQVRDTELYELGLLLGAQVKNEDSYFSRRSATDAMSTTGGGWTYYADQEDVKLWLKHAVPHIIALYDRTTGMAFWRHITIDSVEWTDKGAHIWIPASQQVNEANRELLLSVASSHPVMNWVGSAWDEATAVPSPDRLRFALIAPRIIAPHLNREPAKVSPEEAIASLMLGRFDTIAGYEHRGCMPGPDARKNAGWRWQFLDALSEYMDAANPSGLSECLADASEARDRSASAALLMSCLLEHGRAREVVEMTVPEPDDPVDRDWVRVQRARALYELGQLHQCSELAYPVAALRATHPNDPTAQAIAAAALNLLFSIGWSNDHFEPMVRTNDNAPSWWRAQQRAWGLSAALTHRYEQWIGKGNRSAGKLKDASQRLRSVVLTAGASGDSMAWRQATSELAKFELAMTDRHDDAEKCTETLRRLCVAGDVKMVESAVGRLVSDGPCAAVRSAADQVRLDDATRSSLRSSIALVAAGADVVTPSHADRHASWALGVLEDPAPIAQLSHPVAWFQAELVDMIRKLWQSLTDEGRKQAVNFMSSMGPVPDQLVAQAYASLIKRANPSHWEPAAIEAIRARVQGFTTSANQTTPQPDGDHHSSENTPFGDNWQLADAWRWLIAAAGDAPAKAELIEEATRGDDRAILALGDLAAVPPVAAAQIIERLDESVRGSLRRAEAGMATVNMLNAGRTLVLMNLLFPKHARWEPIYDLLDGPDIPDQIGAVAVIARNPESTPSAVISELLPRLEKLAEAGQPRFAGRLTPDQGTELVKQALDALKPRPAEIAALAKGFSAGRHGRQQVARTLAKEPGGEALVVLIALAYDPDPNVSQTAANGIARGLANGVAVGLSSQVLQDLLTSTGTRHAKAIAEGLAPADAGPEALALLSTLADHPSAQIRELVFRRTT